MSFEPDILVAEAESSRISMVVEARLRPSNVRLGESQLRRYMVAMRVPLGLIVTLDEIAIYRHSYTADSEEAIHLVGRFSLPSHWLGLNGNQTRSGAAAATEPQFEAAVQRWLEQLASYPALEGFSPEAADALSENVLPALVTGIVRAARPRTLKAG